MDLSVRCKLCFCTQIHVSYIPSIPLPLFSRILLEMAMYCEIEGIPFKPQAYERAALAIATIDTSVEEILRQGGGV